MNIVDNVRISAFNQDKEPDESWKAPELVLWYSFRELYRDFKSGKIKEESAKNIKAEILNRYQAQKTEYDTMQNIVRKQAEMWKNIETVGSRYGTERTLENADIFMEAVYGVRIKPTLNASDEEG